MTLVGTISHRIQNPKIVDLYLGSGWEKRINCRDDTLYFVAINVVLLQYI